jgi:photosystem II stability/assembly factor-like uncharacterized protein
MSYHALRIALPGLLLVLLAGGGLFMQSAVSGDTSTPAPASPGPVTGLAIDADGGRLLRAGGGLFQSNDQGRSWTALSLPDEVHADKIRQVATTLEAPSSIYAGGSGAGIVHSDDGGESWRSLSEDLPSQEVGSFAVHSFRPDTLYAWIEGRGVFRTEDGGEQWELMDEGPPASVKTLAHSTLEGSMNTGWLYAATPDGPYLSMDCF